MVYPRFEELHFDKAQFVIEFAELLDEVVDEREGIVVGLLRYVDSGEAGLEFLSQEAALGTDGPFYA
jgi:hypothetical protein